ncbi:MAG: glycosyltransferase family 2 protein [Burkholderiales bacterium]
MGTYKLITVVIPVYREEKNLPKLFARLSAVTSSIAGFDWDYIFVNDGSPDNSIGVLKQLAAQHNNIKIIDFSRNFGKEVALTAGVHAANADAVICMDADLQHPPEVIPKLVEAWQQGAEVVATIRTSIDKQPLLRKVGSHLYYWLMARISGLDMASQTTDFRLFDRKVVDAFRQVTERERMFRGIMDWMGFKKVHVEFEAPAREEGCAGYSYAKLWQLAINSITSFSLFPLRITGYLGMIITSMSGLLLSWMLISNYVLSQKAFTTLAIVVVSNTFLIGIVLMAIGLVALYIGTIHTEVVNRPLYIVREKINFGESRSQHGDNEG